MISFGMYIFSLISMPLCFLTLASFSANRTSSYAGLYMRGLFFALLALMPWYLLRPLYTPVWGSALLVLNFFVGYFFIPFGAATLIYALIGGMAGKAHSLDYDRHAAFIFGFMTLFAIAWTIFVWADPSRIFAILIPLVMLATTAIYPLILKGSYLDGIAKYFFVALGLSLMASTGMALCFMNVRWLGLSISIAYILLCSIMVARHFIKSAKP